MSTTDERMDKVFRKASSMKRRQSRIATPVMGVLALLLGVGLVGSIGYFSDWSASISVPGLYGSSLMLGSDVGAYAIVALLAAAFGTVVTLICINRSKKFVWYDPADTFERDEFRD